MDCSVNENKMDRFTLYIVISKVWKPISAT